MVNFIVVEDQLYFNNKYQDIIDKVSNILETDVRKYVFYDYDENFENITKKNIPNKIYILDIETESNSGLDIARKIRKHDKHSLIIFITAYFEKYSIPLLKSTIGYLKYINKEDNFQEELKNTLITAINEIDFEHFIAIDTLTYSHYIDVKDISYIYTYNRITYIVCDVPDVPYGNKAIKSLIEKLPGYFAISHRACIVNLKKIKHIDKKNLIIYFKNGKAIDFLSKEHLKSIINKLNEMSINQPK